MFTEADQILTETEHLEQEEEGGRGEGGGRREGEEGGGRREDPSGFGLVQGLPQTFGMGRESELALRKSTCLLSGEEEEADRLQSVCVIQCSSFTE